MIDKLVGLLIDFVMALVVLLIMVKAWPALMSLCIAVPFVNWPGLLLRRKDGDK